MDGSVHYTTSRNGYKSNPTFGGTLEMKALILSLLLLTGCTGYHIYAEDFEIANKVCKSNGGLLYFKVSGSIDSNIHIICNNGMQGIKKRTITKKR